MVNGEIRLRVIIFIKLELGKGNIWKKKKKNYKFLNLMQIITYISKGLKEPQAKKKKKGRKILQSHIHQTASNKWWKENLKRSHRKKDVSHIEEQR